MSLSAARGALGPKSMPIDPPYSLIVRFPFGVEFWYSDQLPLVGTTITRRGQQYGVAASEPTSDRTFVLTVVDEDRRRVGVPASAV